jgi:hypothetical protein
MAVNTQKLVRVLSATGPTGPNATLKRVAILSAFTGPTGTFPVWGQINAAQQASAPTGTFEEVVYIPNGPTGVKGEMKTVIIPGFTGPA